MSALNYVVIYHMNGETSVHSYSSWELILREFQQDTPTQRLVEIPGPFGNISVMRRCDMESIHLITEDEVEWNSQRHAAIAEIDKKTHGEDWK